MNMKLTKIELQAIIQEELENLMEQDPHSLPSWLDPAAQKRHQRKHRRRQARKAALPPPEHINPARKFSSRFRPGAEKLATWLAGSEERGKNVYGKPGSKSQSIRPFDDPRLDRNAPYPGHLVQKDAERRGKNVHVGGPHVPEPNEPKLDLMGRAPGEPGYGKYPKKDLKKEESRLREEEALEEENWE